MPSVQLPKKEALIVDDDVRARELLSELCRVQGFEVATAHDGRVAIAAITRDPGQFALFDAQGRVGAALRSIDRAQGAARRDESEVAQTTSVAAMNSDVSVNPILS